MCFVPTAWVLLGGVASPDWRPRSGPGPLRSSKRAAARLSSSCPDPCLSLTIYLHRTIAEHPSSIACTHAACQTGRRLDHRYPFAPSKESAGLLSATEVILPAVSETWSIMGLELRFAHSLLVIHQSRVEHAFVSLNGYQFFVLE